MTTLDAIGNRDRRNMEEDKKKKRDRAIVLIIVGAIALALVLVSFYKTNATQDMLAGNLFPGTGVAEAGHLPEMTEEQIMAQMQKVADETTFSFKINAQPIFEQGSSKGTLRIENPGHNVYPFVVEIYLSGTGQKIYDSGGVLPGHYIDTAKLDVPLEEGIHEAVAYINAFDPDTREYQGRSAVDLSIIVKG